MNYFALRKSVIKQSEQNTGVYNFPDNPYFEGEDTV